MTKLTISRTSQGLFSLLVVLLLLAPRASYANMPVIDINAIAQSILQYNQMVQKVIKYEKELKKIGVDTGRVGGILGQLDGMTNGILSSMEAVKNLPEGLANLFQELNTQCELLRENEIFKNAIATEKSKIESVSPENRDQMACLKIINDAEFLKNEIERNALKAKDFLKKGDFSAYRSSINKAKNIINAQAYLQKTTALERKYNYEMLYAHYLSGEGDANGLSKKNLEARYKNLLSQAMKSNTQTDAQNLGNQLLAEIVNTLRLQFDVIMQYNSAMLALQTQDTNIMDKTNLTQKSDDELKEEQAKVDVFATDSPFEKYKGEYKKDALGLPIIGVSSK